MPVRGGIRYLPSPYQRPLFQGDILRGVPLTLALPNENKWILLRAPETSDLTQADLLRGKRPKVFVPKSEEAVQDAWASQELVVARASKSPVMLVTQTCDLDWRKTYQVVPIRTAAQLSPEKMESLRADDIGYWYHLPARPPELIEESFADLTLMTSVHRSYFKDAIVECRLTNAERSFFQKALSHFHGSPFGYNPSDRVPETARYGCISCFHAGGKTTRQLKTGRTFPKCPKCDDNTMWVAILG